MYQFLYFTATSAFLVLLLALALVLIILEKCTQKEPAAPALEPPSPRSLPIIGHLHLLGGYEIPYQAFSDLGMKYGSVIKLKLGNVNSVVVNGQENIREVLVAKGHHFDSRPNFERYQRLFGGNKQNSLAFCDWSETQRIRREMLRAYTFPRAFTNKFASLEDIIGRETSSLLSSLGSPEVELKPVLLRCCANIFTSHFCSKSFSADDTAFTEMIENFDEIFYEVNQGYAADFLPFLLPLHQSHLAEMNQLAHKIRQFIVDNVFEERYRNFSGEEASDYVESLIQHLKVEENPCINWEGALFALEDIIGGHSAVGNFVMKLLAYLVNEPEVQNKIQREIDSVTYTNDGFRAVCISDRTAMPYTEGAIFEAVRLVASPIVPRAANQETTINGFRIKKGTLVFLNNYELSMSEKLWDEPKSFKPERFIVNNHVVKPEHFLPFGGGRRSCMGYKMVQLISFGVLSSILQNYSIVPVEGENYKVPVGSLALPKNTFRFKFARR